MSSEQPRRRRTSYYDVYLSFHKDAMDFTRKLCNALREKRIMTFLGGDDVIFESSGERSNFFFEAIEECRISIVVLSNKYASSRWCLDELTKFMERRREPGNFVVCPLFYNIDPSDVKRQRGTYEEAMTRLANRFGGDRVKTWKSALNSVAQFVGYVYPGRDNEDKFIRDVSELVSQSLLPYDVFISFSHPDTGYAFTKNLENALREKNINTFLKNDRQKLKLKLGGQISSSFLKAINESKISIVVLSENYASSTWCLDELDNIIECKKTKNNLVWPIFYKVDPSHVSKQKAHVGIAMADHESRFDSEKVQKWKSSLSKVADLTGWPHQIGYEYELIQRIVESVVQSLSCYDVFLNFSAEDIRYTFAGYLYNVLRQSGFKTYMDDEGLEDGNKVSHKVIENSRHSLIIFSENYAYSSWCLDELVKIVERMKTENHLIWPIFFKVDPSDVEHQRGSYGDAMVAHEKRLGEDSPEVKKWRSALSEVIYLGGYWRENRSQVEYIEKENESEFIKEIVKHLQLNPGSKELTQGPSTGGFKISSQGNVL